MRKLKKRISLILVFSMLLALLVPSTTLAATTSLIATSTIKTQVVKSGSMTYKISCPGEGYITFAASEGYGFEVYDYRMYLVNTINGFTGQSIKVPVSKGYVYVKCPYYSDLASSGKTAYFKYKFVPVKQQTNYCKGRALSLDRLEKVVFYQTPNYHFTRWVKIKTTKRQAIRVTSNDVKLYNSKLQEVKLEFESATSDTYIYKSAVVDAGTYYIKTADRPMERLVVYWK